MAGSRYSTKHRGAARDADNLRMETKMPNTYREIVQSRHPDLR